jgi:hypothetical protein
MAAAMRVLSGSINLRFTVASSDGTVISSAPSIFDRFLKGSFGCVLHESGFTKSSGLRFAGAWAVNPAVGGM